MNSAFFYGLELGGLEREERRDDLLDLAGEKFKRHFGIDGGKCVSPILDDQVDLLVEARLTIDGNGLIYPLMCDTAT